MVCYANQFIHQKCYTEYKQKHASTCKMQSAPASLHLQPNLKETLPSLLVVTILGMPILLLFVSKQEGSC